MTWTSPFSIGGSWFKGNLHTHTTQSDGLYTVEEAIAWYRSAGYDFLAISDHWVVTPGRQAAPGFVTISAAELHGATYHMLALGITDLPDQAMRESPAEIAQDVARQGGLAYMAHPYWAGQTSAQIIEVSALDGIEIYNSVCEKMDGLGHAAVHWDELLAQGRRLTGLAVDDVHWKHNAAGGGFVMVRAPELSEAALLSALRQGHFYSSTGPAILDLRVTPGADGQPMLAVRCSPCRAITFYGRASSGHRFEAERGSLIDGATWPVQPNQGYLRVACQGALGDIAWSNPVYVEDILHG